MPRSKNAVNPTSGPPLPWGRINPNDPTERLPSVPVGDDGRAQKTVPVRVVSTREWFDNWALHKEGEEETLYFPVDENDEPTLNEHVVRAEEYEAPQIDLPATNLSKEKRFFVRGGASGHPNL